MVIGITGGVGSGKSTVCRYLENLGIPVIDADRTGHEVLELPECIMLLREAFGDDIAEDGRISRPMLAERAFASKEAADRLNNITHPIIIKKIQEKIEHLSKKNDIIALELPLLYECGLEYLVDKVWVVYADKATRISRLKERGMPEEDAERRIAVQMSLEEKAEKADFVIDKSIDWVLPEEDIARLLRFYKAESRTH